MSRGPDVYAKNRHQTIGDVSNSLGVSEVFELLDDFLNIDTTATVGDWTLAGDNTETCAVGDAAGGIATLSTNGAQDNNEAWIENVHETFKFDTNKRVSFECRMACTEAATDAANWMIGLGNVEADMIVDDAASPFIIATTDGAFFYKLDGTMAINFATSNAATQTTAAFPTLVPVTAQYYRLGFSYDYNDKETANVYAWVYDETAKEKYFTPVQTVTISGLLEMNAFFYVKCGTTDVQTLTFDYVKVTQER